MKHVGLSNCLWGCNPEYNGGSMRYGCFGRITHSKSTGVSSSLILAMLSMSITVLTCSGKSDLSGPLVLEFNRIW